MKYRIIILLAVIAAAVTSCTSPTEASPAVHNHYKLGIYNIDEDSLTIIKDFGNIEAIDEPHYALFHPDGSKIVYYMQGSLYAIDIDGSDETNITGDLVVDADFPFAAEDCVYFAAYNGDLRDIYRTSWDGSTTTNLTNTPEIDEHQPYLDPNNEKFLCVATKDAMEIIQEYDLSTSSVACVYTSHVLALHYPGYHPTKSAQLFYYGDNMSMLDENTDSLQIIATNPNPPISGQLSFNTKYSCLFYTSGYLYKLNIETNECSEVTHSIRSVRYPTTSEESDWISIYSWDRKAILIINIVDISEIIEIHNGYFSSLSNHTNSALILLNN